jgi:hypothetical protein
MPIRNQANPVSTATTVHSDDALMFLMEKLGNPRGPKLGQYGYGVWLPDLVVTYLKEIEGNTDHYVHGSDRLRLLSPIFYDAAWELCRRGILRPGLARMHEQATDTGGSGDGYTLTEYGKQWLLKGAPPIPIDPGRLQQQFQKLSGPFGQGFLQRASEAVLAHRFLWMYPRQ